MRNRTAKVSAESPSSSTNNIRNVGPFILGLTFQGLGKLSGEVETGQTKPRMRSRSTVNRPQLPPEMYGSRRYFRTADLAGTREIRVFTVNWVAPARDCPDAVATRLRTGTRRHLS